MIIGGPTNYTISSNVSRFQIFNEFDPLAKILSSLLN